MHLNLYAARLPKRCVFVGFSFYHWPYYLEHVMALTPESFGRLALSDQFHVLLSHGLFLNLRFEETYAVTHYLLNGFFADLYYTRQAPLPERIQVLDGQLW